MHHPNLITAIINILCRPIETERNKKVRLKMKIILFLFTKLICACGIAPQHCEVIMSEW
ncbi:hypothetical protein A79E_3009 [Klebsiella pneumoniae subsp. pneumoniae 1084]|nr:hypothetical protein A79E_3009 [Klebsiella pneumoniae subsp. pneumoniae 1084]AGT24776.1 hypothetical protein N559_3114 [Klebsiella pneumoniae JM45]